MIEGLAETRPTSTWWTPSSAPRHRDRCAQKRLPASPGTKQDCTDARADASVLRSAGSALGPGRSILDGVHEVVRPQAPRKDVDAVCRQRRTDNAERFHASRSALRKSELLECRGGNEEVAFAQRSTVNVHKRAVTARFDRGGSATYRTRHRDGAHGGISVEDMFRAVVVVRSSRGFRAGTLEAPVHRMKGDQVARWQPSDRISVAGRRWRRLCLLASPRKAVVRHSERAEGRSLRAVPRASRSS